MANLDMVNLNIKVKADVKRQMESVCNDLGLSINDAINIFIQKMVTERRFPFEVSLDPFYSESNIRYLEGVYRDFKEGKFHFAEYDLIEED